MHDLYQSREEHDRQLDELRASMIDQSRRSDINRLRNRVETPAYDCERSSYDYHWCRTHDSDFSSVLLDCEESSYVH